MGEKGNASLGDALMGAAEADPVSALEALPLDAIKGSPETINAWLDTYLKYREVKELRKANEAAVEASQAATDATVIASAIAAGKVAEAEKPESSPPPTT